jgi:hypothetical protein
MTFAELEDLLNLIGTPPTGALLKTLMHAKLLRTTSEMCFYV